MSDFSDEVPDRYYIPEQIVGRRLTREQLDELRLVNQVDYRNLIATIDGGCVGE